MVCLCGVCMVGVGLVVSVDGQVGCAGGERPVRGAKEKQTGRMGMSPSDADSGPALFPPATHTGRRGAYTDVRSVAGPSWQSFGLSESVQHEI